MADFTAPLPTGTQHYLYVSDDVNRLKDSIVEARNLLASLESALESIAGSKQNTVIGTVQRVYWNGTSFALKDNTVATNANRPVEVFRDFVGGPHPDTLGLWQNGDTYQTAANV